jgi:hypothetical protein
MKKVPSLGCSAFKRCSHSWDSVRSITPPPIPVKPYPTNDFLAIRSPRKDLAWKVADSSTTDKGRAVIQAQPSEMTTQTTSTVC